MNSDSIFRDLINDGFGPLIGIGQETKKRACLKCGMTFKSSGKGHRICSHCKKENRRLSHLATTSPWEVRRQNTAS